MNSCIDVFEYSERPEDNKKFRRLIEVKQTAEFENTTSYSKIQKIRDQYLQPAVTHHLECRWRWDKLDYYTYKLILDQNYIIVVSNNLLYICDFERRKTICPINALGMITLHRNYIKDYIDFSSYDLNFANNFRYCFDERTDTTELPLYDDRTTNLLCSFDRGNFMSLKIHTTEGKIMPSFKALMHSEKDKTLSSGIAILRIQDDVFIAQSSRYTDFLLYKLEHERDLKRQKVSEDEIEYSEIHSLTAPRMVVVDRIHVHGALEDLQILNDKKKDALTTSDVKGAQKGM